PNVEPRASRALAAADDEVVRALESYRHFRSGWRIVDAPQEPQAVVAFLEARRALELEESRLGAALPEGPGRADAGIKDLEATGKALERLLAASRDAAGRVEAPRGASAAAWVE